MHGPVSCSALQFQDLRKKSTACGLLGSVATEARCMDCRTAKVSWSRGPSHMLRDQSQNLHLKVHFDHLIRTVMEGLIVHLTLAVRSMNVLSVHVDRHIYIYITHINANKQNKHTIKVKQKKTAQYHIMYRYAICETLCRYICKSDGEFGIESSGFHRLEKSTTMRGCPKAQRQWSGESYLKHCLVPS